MAKYFAVATIIGLAIILFTSRAPAREYIEKTPIIATPFHRLVEFRKLPAVPNLMIAACQGSSYFAKAFSRRGDVGVVFEVEHQAANIKPPLPQKASSLRIARWVTITPFIGQNTEIPRAQSIRIGGDKNGVILYTMVLSENELTVLSECFYPVPPPEEENSNDKLK